MEPVAIAEGSLHRHGDFDSKEDQALVLKELSNAEIEGVVAVMCKYLKGGIGDRGNPAVIHFMEKLPDPSLRRKHWTALAAYPKSGKFWVLLEKAPSC